MKKLIIASYNKGKVKELQTMLAPYGYTLLNAEEANLPDVEETEDTFHGNARLKVESAFEQTNTPSLADDSGFCANALNGAPGVYSARYEGGMHRVLQEVEGKDRSAYFMCVLAYKDADGQLHYFEGKAEGTIPDAPRGEGGFGYDPIFVPNGYQHTFAELPSTEKNKMSARAKALAKFIDFIQK